MNKDYTNMKKVMLITGIVLIVVGIILLIYGFSTFGTFFGSGESNGEVSDKGFSSIGFISAGGFLSIIGFKLIYISQFRRTTRYFATEGSPAIKTASKAIGDGLKESGISSSYQKEIIKIKCPNCGYLESEDAEFCSKCGKKI